MYERSIKPALASSHSAVLAARQQDATSESTDPNLQVLTSSAPPGLSPPVPPSGLDWVGLVQPIVATLWSKRRFAIFVCLLLGSLAGTAKWLAGPSYTASLIIKPDLRGRQAPAGSGPSPTIDGSSLVESQMEMFRSHAVAKRVVEKLGMVEPPQQQSWVNRLIKSGMPTAVDHSAAQWIDRALGAWTPTAADKAANNLIAKLSARRSQLSYLIRVTYTAKSPDEAARVLNALASEYIRAGRLQSLADRYHVANAALADLSRQYGSKHPLIVRAARDAASQRAALEQEEESTLRLMTSDELAASGLVLPAEAITIPSGMGVAGATLVGMLLGLFLAAAMILFRARKLLLGSLWPVRGIVTK